MKILPGKQIFVHTPHEAINHGTRSQTGGKIVCGKKLGFFLTQLQELGFQETLLSRSAPFAESSESLGKMSCGLRTIRRPGFLDDEVVEGFRRRRRHVFDTQDSM